MFKIKRRLVGSSGLVKDWSTVAEFSAVQQLEAAIQLVKFVQVEELMYSANGTKAEYIMTYEALK